MPVLETGIRIVDLVCPVPMGGSLAISGDAGSGVVTVAMEVTRNLCRRHQAKAVCHVTAGEPFTESNVRGWIAKLHVEDFIEDIVPGDRAEISIPGVVRLFPYAESAGDADGWVVLRRALFEQGRLPGVDLDHSGSRLADADPKGLAQRVKSEVARGNSELIGYLSQPFFVAEPWTGRPGEVTDRREMLERVERLLLV